MRIVEGVLALLTARQAVNSVLANPVGRGEDRNPIEAIPISYKVTRPSSPTPTSTKLSSKIKREHKALSKHTKKHFQTPSEPYRSYHHRAPFKGGVLVVEGEEEVRNGSWSSWPFLEVSQAYICVLVGPFGHVSFQSGVLTHAFTLITPQHPATHREIRTQNHNKQMDVHFEDFRANQHTVEVGADDTVEGLRRKVATAMGLPEDSFCMSFGDEAMGEGADMTQLSAGDTIILTKTKKGHVESLRERPPTRPRGGLRLQTDHDVG